MTFRTEPGQPPVWVMRIDHHALAQVEAADHVHDFPGLVFFAAPGGRVGTGGQRWHVEAGDVFVVRPGALIEVDGADHLVGAGGWGLYFTPEALGRDAARVSGPLDWWLHPLLRLFADAGGPVRLNAPPVERPAWIADLEGIERELRLREPGFREAALSRLVLRLVSAARLAATARLADPAADGATADPATADSATASAASSDLLGRVFEIIDRRFREQLSLADVADAVHLSPGHLTTTVRRRTGRTVQDWIVERRLAEARRLLVESDLPVGEVGRRSGWPDPTYFARVFRGAQGVTPRAWRSASR